MRRAFFRPDLPDPHIAALASSAIRLARLAAGRILRHSPSAARHSPKSASAPEAASGIVLPVR